jgi:hypothetical protein
MDRLASVAGMEIRPMLRRSLCLAAGALLLALGFASPAAAQRTEPRIALVVGNAGYGPGALPTALNDAGLVAEALRSIGFDIVEGGDLTQPDMLRAFRDFLEKVEDAGPDAIAAVYFSGHAVTFEGDNFLLGIDARLDRESDIPIEGVRLSDLLRPLADSPARAKVVMIDAARPLPFRPQGRGLAPGLEAVEAPDGVLIAYSNAPATVASDGSGDYGAYATAIAEMLRAPGIDLETAFTHIRSRTHQLTEGEQTPWHDSALGEEIELVPPEAATASLPPPPPLRAVRPMRELGPDEAYGLAIERDTLDGYVEFVEFYPDHPYSERFWYIIRARREALVWRRALDLNTREAYWTYLRRYPNGVYAYDAERRLRRLSAPLLPPAGFAMLALAGIPLALRNEPRDHRRSLRVGPPPPNRLIRPAPASIANLPPPRRTGTDRRRLPTMTAPIPAITNLAPAPRRDRSTAPRRSRDPALTSRPPGTRGTPRTAPSTTTRTPTVAPSAVTPSPGTATRTPAPSTAAPSTTAPSVTTAPAAVPTDRRRPSDRTRPTDRDRQPGAAPRPSPPAATRTPSPAPAQQPAARPSRPPPSATRPAAPAPSAVAPSAPPPAATPAPERRRPDLDRRDPRRPRDAAPPAARTSPPSGTQPPAATRPSPPQPSAARPPDRPRPPAARTAPPPPQPTARPSPPPQRPSPPPAAAARPAPAPAARPTPPPQRSSPPPAAAAKPSPPPRRPPEARAKPPSCPAGQVLVTQGGRQVCQTPR